MHDSLPFRRLALQISDGSEVPWEEAALDLSAEKHIGFLSNLKALSDIANFHREGLSLDEDLRESRAERWGHLTILSKAGEGACSQVFRARDCWLDHEVALKLIDARSASEHLLKPGEPGTRVISEANRMARVRHHNVVSVYGAEMRDGMIGIWMELIEGQTLEEIVEQHGPMGPQEAAVLGIDVCRALAAIHAAGLLHCDVKARNVMREQGGRIVLMDLGVARADTPDPHQPGGGTPLYMAPELLKGENATRKSDLYSLGVLLYFLLTGRHPISATSLTGLQEAHANQCRRLLADDRPGLPTCFTAVVQKALSPDPETRFDSAGEMIRALQEVVQDRETPAPRRPGLRGVYGWLALLAALALLVFGALRISTTSPLLQSGNNSIAVLPLMNVASDPDTEYLSEGITYSLINRLSQVSRLQVAPRTTVFRLSREADPMKIGKELGVGVVLTGQVSRRGNVISVQVDMVDVKEGMQIWGERYERTLEGIQRIEDEITRSVLRRLSVPLDAGGERLTRRQTSNPEAYRLFLKGHHLWSKFTEGGAKTAIESFKQAIQLDPGFADAYSSLANCYITLAQVGDMRPRDAYPLAEEYALKAIDLDERLAAAHVTLGAYNLYYTWDFAEAERELKRGLDLDPRSADGLGVYATYLTVTSRLHEAEIEKRKALDIDPLSPLLQMNLGGIHYFERRYDEAVREVRRALELEPNLAFGLYILGCAHGQKGEYEQALVELERARQIPGGFVAATCEMVNVLGKSGQREKGMKLLEEVRSRAGTHFVDAFFVATACVGLGEIDEAFAWLERGFQERCFMMTTLHIEPKFDPIRSDPRFQDLLTRIGLP